MAKQPPYEEMDQQWSDAPLPDSDQAWQKMKTMLDKEDERKRRFLPFFFLNSCAGWSLLLVAAFGFGVWFYVSQNKKNHELAAIEKPVSKGNVLEQRHSNTEERTTPELGQATIDKTKTTTTESTPAQREKVNATAQNNENKVGDRSTSTETSVKKSATTELTVNTLKHSSKRDVAINEQKIKNKSAKTNVKHRNEQSVAVVKQVLRNELLNKMSAKDNDIALQNKIEKDNNKTSTENKPSTPLTVKDVAEVKHADTKPGEKKDSVKQNKTDNKPTDKTETAKQQNKHKEDASFSIGLGIHHLIPTGQYTYKENYNGKTNLLSEHMPSVFLQAKKGKMNAQLEARFASPQVVKDFAFSERMIYDTINNKLLTKQYRLRKAYYHQFALSFNYEVLPHLTVGMGGMYSLFYRAVTQQETRTKDLQNGSETTSYQNIQVPHFSDSFFFKTQMQVLFQTAYEWKRWSVGLRYKKDLEPFIRYTTPDGALKEEKNGVLEAVVKWQIWKQKKKPNIK